MMHHRISETPRLRAFTLIELLIILAVLGIIASMAAPLVIETAATKLQAAGRLLIADLQFAQTGSIAHPDALYALRFDTSTATYEVVQGTSLPFGCSGATVVTNPVDNRSYTTTFGSGRAAPLDAVTIDSVSLDSDNCLAFGTLGETDQTTAATITLRSGSGTLTVSVDPISGEATVSP